MSFQSARKKTGLSQIAAAKAIGVTDAAVSMWENGHTNPRASLLVVIAGVYGCTIDELLEGNSKRSEIERRKDI